MKKRLFLGTMLPITDAEHLADMRQAIEPTLLEWWNCELRWVRPDKLHITWLFIGDCDAEQEQAILKSMESMELHKTSLDYAALSLFGESGRSNAGVLLPKEISSTVKELGATLRKNLNQFCHKEEEHPFRPHLTLFRFPRDNKMDYQIQDGLDISKYIPLHQNINHITLIESHAGPDGIDYKTLADFNLKGND